MAHAAAIKTTLIIFGLATSIPLIIAGSAVLMALLERFKVLVWGGGALLGWVAGEIMVTDPAVVGWIGDAVHAWGGRVGAIFVVLVGMWMVRRHRRIHSEEVWTFIALLVWVASDIAFDLMIEHSEPGKRWAARLVIFLLLISDYVAFRGRGVLQDVAPLAERDGVEAKPHRRAKSAHKTN
jgi:predicted tellurium resistance membrane protein TerC